MTITFHRLEKEKSRHFCRLSLKRQSAGIIPSAVALKVLWLKKNGCQTREEEGYQL